MWIRTTMGAYVNSDNIFSLLVTELPSGDLSLTANTISGEHIKVAIFTNKAEAQNYLDKMMKVIGGRMFEVDMADWNYTGHKKDHKETRRGGS